MRRYKVISGGYLCSVGTGCSGTEIPEEEYQHLLALIRSCPEADVGYVNRLTEELHWVPEPAPEQTEEEEAEEADYLAALAELGVKANA